MNNRITRGRIAVVSAAMCLMLTSISELRAQIDVAPVHVLFTSRQRDAEVVVSNSLDETVEVTSGFGFRMLRSDSLGKRVLDSIVTAADMAHSCRSWLKIYPKKFSLPAHGSRSVRIVIVPPDTLADGEYWARLELTGVRAGRPKPVTADTGLTLDLRMHLRVGIPVMFRKGRVETGLEIGPVLARRADSGIILLVGSRRLGNGIYRGTLNVTVRNDGGDEFQGAQEFTNETELRSMLLLPDLHDGTYDLDIKSTAVRTGTIKAIVLAAPPVDRSYRLQVVGRDVTIHAGK